MNLLCTILFNHSQTKIKLNTHSKADALVVHDAAEGAHVGVHGGPFSVAAVLSSLQQVLTAAVVWKLIEDPGAIFHLSRVDFVEVPVLRDVAQVLCAFVHLTAEVRTLVDTDDGRAGDLEDRDEG